MHGHPAPDAHADRTYLGLAPVDIAGPDADPTIAAKAFDAEIGQGRDYPSFERMDEAADITRPLSQV